MNGATFKDEPIQKRYFRISDIAKELHVAHSLVRYWGKQFHLQLKRNKHNDRLFTVEDRETMREIYYLLKVEFLTIKGAKKRLEGLYNYQEAHTDKPGFLRFIIRETIELVVIPLVLVAVIMTGMIYGYLRFHDWQVQYKTIKQIETIKRPLGEPRK